MKKRIIQSGLIVVFFILLSIYLSTETLIVFKKLGIATTFAEQIKLRLLQWIPWALLTVFVFKFAKRHPIDLKKWYAKLPVHLMASVFFSLIHSVLYLLFAWLFLVRPANMADAFVTLLIKSTHFNLLVYAIMISLWNMWTYYQKNRENELKTTRMKSQLIQAQLNSLRGQLNPHFLFNTLHMIMAHVRKNPQKAEKMIDRLSDLLRKSLEMPYSQEISLNDEIEYLKIYLEIQETRFEDRLKTKFDINPESLNVRVPNLLLQPIVENAIQYAVAPLTQGGSINIASRIEDNMLCLVIKDSGPGFPEDKEILYKKGFGLNTTRERLQLLYGENFHFILENSDGAQVSIKIPLRRANDRDSQNRP